jgi:tetratricopeptide (TPR) repeat protein
VPQAYEELHALLERARALNEARDYPSLAELLRGVPEEDRLREPELGFLLADVLRRVGQGAEALEVLEGLSAVLGRRGNDRLHRRRLNLMGTLHFEQGRIEEAKEAWSMQVRDSSSAEDDEFLARANNNLGILATMATSWAVALAHYARAVAAYQKLGYQRGLGQSHQNLAITYREMGFGSESARHFQQAIHFASPNSEDEVARAEQERALLLLVEGDINLARVTALRAIGRYRRLADPVGEAEVERVLGLVALGSARPQDARRHFQAALDLGEQAHAVLLVAETLEAQAALARSTGDHALATESATRAEEIFLSLGAPAWGSQTRKRAEQIAEVGTRGSSHRSRDP